MTLTLRPYQQDGLNALWKYFQDGNTGNPLLSWPTGCHAKSTKILMYDGSLKNVEDVIVSDLLMGPDSQPRKVLSLARGRETMVKVIPTKGEEFVVNLNHILSLKTTQEKGEDKKYHLCHLQKGNIENIKISDYVNKSKWFKHTRKLWRSPVDFYCEPELYISPYNLGLFLGDGSYCVANVSLTSMDDELLTSFKNEAISKGDIVRIEATKSKAKQLVIRRSKTDAKSYRSEFAEILTYLGLQEKRSECKFIPIDYKINSRENRLQLLAGLMDTDGSLTGTSCYDYVSKSKQLADDIVFISRSLGFAAYSVECIKWGQNKTKGIYHRVSISGNVYEIPVKLERKKAKPRLQKKNVLVTGFKYELLEEDDYYGFELDGDNLYLTGDFTVHHNTGKSIVPAIFIESILKIWPTQRFLLLTHVKELIAQNSEVLRTVWPEAPLGIYSAGLKEKNPIMPIVYGGVQSAKNNPHLFGHRDIIFIDEAHLINQDDASMYLTFLSTMKLINPHVKIIGMTATPFRMGQGYITDGGIFTDIVHDLCNMENFNQLIADGYLAPLVPLRTKIELDIGNVGILKGDFNQGQLQHAVDVAKVTWEGLRELVEAGRNKRSWLLFASGIEHSEHIAEMLGQFGIDCAAVHSKKSAEYNDKAIRAFKDFSLRAIVNYGKLTTGFNHPQIDLIGDFRPTMSVPLHVQKMGRGTRPADLKKDCIAEGSLVLTDIGLVKIENITLDMKLWDGYNFVRHDGVIYKGYKEVLTYAGLTATPDHKVYTKEGWQTFRQSFIRQNEIARTGFGRKTIWQAKNYFTRNPTSWKEAAYLCFDRMSDVFSTKLESLLQFNSIQSWLSGVWKQPYLASASQVAAKTMYSSQRSLHQFKQSSLQRLWRSWYSIQFLQTDRNGDLDNAKSWFTQTFRNRSHRQRKSLSSWKFKVCYKIRKYGKSKNICSETPSISYRHVYDILNVGSNNQFTVNDLLVHNCLVLDYARNTPRLGPINDPMIPRKKGESVGEVPVKVCDFCGVFNHIKNKTCTHCQTEFNFEIKITKTAGHHELIKSDQPIIEDFNVDRVIYKKHEKFDKAPCLKVTYYTGIRSFNEWLFPQSMKGPGRHMFHTWWRQRSDIPPPATVDDALNYCQHLKKPTSIKVWCNKANPEVMECIF